MVLASVKKRRKRKKKKKKKKKEMRKKKRERELKKRFVRVSGDEFEMSTKRINFPFLLIHSSFPLLTLFLQPHTHIQIHIHKNRERVRK